MPTRSSSAIAKSLGLTALGLGALSFWLQHRLITSETELSPDLVALFNVSLENNVPASFATLLLVVASLMLGAIALREVELRAGSRRYWVALSLMLAAMAVDERFSFHERLVEPTRTILGLDRLGVFYNAWVIPGIVFVIVVGLLFAKFLRDLPPATRRRFLLAGALFVAGAIGVESIGGYYAELGWGDRTLLYHALSTAEEMLEMIGVIVLIGALLEYRRSAQGVMSTLPSSSSSRSATASGSRAAER